MKYNEPYGGVADAAYINGDPSIGRAGSIPPAEAIEYPQREIANLVTDSGLTPANTDLRQLGKGVQRGTLNYAVDAGTVNAMAVTLTPVPTYTAGLIVRAKVNATNTGASTINVNALGAKAIVRRDGAALLAGDLVANSIAQMIYNGTSFELVGAVNTGKMVANLIIFVNSAIGNDANDGTANISGKALATIQAAINLAWSYAPSQFTITINVKGAGPYAGAITPLWPGPSTIVNGDGAATTFIAAGATYGLAVQGPNQMTVQNISISNTVPTGGAAAFAALAGGTLTTLNTASGACGGSVFQAFTGSLVPGTHSFNGNSYTLFWANFGGHIQIPTSTTYTITGGGITMGLASAFAAGNGSIGVGSPSSATFTGGTVTGSRYLCSGAGGIDSSGNGVNYFPGTIAGTTSSSGWYV